MSSASICKCKSQSLNNTDGTLFLTGDIPLVRKDAGIFHLVVDFQNKAKAFKLLVLPGFLPSLGLFFWSLEISCHCQNVKLWDNVLPTGCKSGTLGEASFGRVV